jgi:hypothetical protein
MDSPHGDLHHLTKSQRPAYYLLVSIILGTDIYFLVEGISQFWH